MLWQRLALGSLMILALCGVVALDGWLSVPAAPGDQDLEVPGQLPGVSPRCALPVTLLVMILVLSAAYELGGLLRAAGYRPVTHWAAFIAAGLALAPWMEMQQGAGRIAGLSPVASLNLPLTILWAAGGVIGACLLILTRRTTEQAVTSIAVTLLIFLYVGLLGSFVVRIRCLDTGLAGAALVILFILTVKAGDIGAYFAGLSFGRHKLAPWLSPGKTVEGFVGAIVLAGVAAAGAMAGWHRLAPPGGKDLLNVTQALVFAVVMAVCGHLGDLVESAMKRDLGIKDSGHVVPAFGGFLDLFDSVLLAAPIAWWLLTLWTPVG